MAKSLVAALSVCGIALAWAQQQCSDTANYCPDYPNIEAGSVSLAATCSQTSVNVTISNNGGKLYGGLLGFICISSNVSCTYIIRGPVIIKERNSVLKSLDPGTRCVVFGCYHINWSTRMYKLEETFCTVPAVPDPVKSSILTLYQTSSNSTDLIPTSSLDVVFASMMSTASVPSPVKSTVVPGVTPSGVSTATNGVETAALFTSSVSNIILVIIGAMVTILAVLGSVLLLIIIIRKIRREKSLNSTEWFDNNYRPVKITGLANMSLSLSTLIESLENTKEGCSKEDVYNKNNGNSTQLSSDNTPTHSVAETAMEKLLHSSDESSPPTSSFGTERMHQLSEEQNDSSNASNSNCSRPSSMEPFAKEQVDGDDSICDSNQPSAAVLLESELSFESDLSSYTSEVSQF
ncbi:hypothetical protein EMCRGX_G034399 [Ephydatia muelleri]